MDDCVVAGVRARGQGDRLDPAQVQLALGTERGRVELRAIMAPAVRHDSKAASAKPTGAVVQVGESNEVPNFMRNHAKATNLAFAFQAPEAGRYIVVGDFNAINILSWQLPLV